MTIYYSKFGLNTYSHTPYFQENLPPDRRQTGDRPLSLTLLRSRAFRRLPPNVRQLAARAKEWALRNDQKPTDIDRYYDDSGHELNPATGKRLTDAEIDAAWGGPAAVPGLVVEDIPRPRGGFPDPDTWEPEAPEPATVDRSEITEADVIRDVASRGIQATATAYGVPPSRIRGVTTAEELAKVVLGMHGEPASLRESEINAERLAAFNRGEEVYLATAHGSDYEEGTPAKGKE